MGKRKEGHTSNQKVLPSFSSKKKKKGSSLISFANPTKTWTALYITRFSNIRTAEMVKRVA